MDEPKSFPERLGALLAESGARHSQVARWMDVHRVSVTQWLSGRSEPRGGSESFERLAKFFGCPPEWLYFGRGKRPSKTAVIAAVHAAIATLGPDDADDAEHIAEVA